MTATQTAIRPHDELTIEPEAIIPESLITYDHKESGRRGRDFSVYRVASRSEPGVLRTVTHNKYRREIYCLCPAARRGLKCAHVKSVLFLRLYDETFRLYVAATLPELQEQDRTLGHMERGTLVPIRGWRAIKSAIGDLIADKTKEAA